MRLVQSKNQFAGKNVLIMGLGSKDGGVGAARFAHDAGANLTITDLKDKQKLQPALHELNHIPYNGRFGFHHLDDFLNTDIIIKNPGIRRENRYLQKAEQANVIIDSPCGIFSEIYKNPFVGITGTKGKSYTTHLTAHLLKQFKSNCIAAGNNCVSPLRYVLDNKNNFILELSSWQLYEMGLHKKSPQIACWLNLFDDHMNYYTTIADYKEDKYNIARYQEPEDYLVLPWDKSFYQSLRLTTNKLFFDIDQNSDLTGNSIPGCFIKDNKIVVRLHNQEEKVIPIKELPREFSCYQHLELLLASVCNTLAFLLHSGFTNISIKKLKEGIKSFPGLSYRFEVLADEDKREIINDSASSTPQSTEIAIDAVKFKPCILILGGGGHKNLKYDNLIKKIADNNIEAIVFSEDETSTLLIQGFEKWNYKNFHIVKTMGEAVRLGYSRIKNNGTLLLSPGCSGAPFFRDMFERGEIFKNHVNKLL
jgi:UDP-N-acetylmuramoylalanine--D-glutamate ligase